jgi:hypothetical protein
MQNPTRKAPPVTNLNPLIRQLFDHIDAHPTLTRSMVWDKAGYDKRTHRAIASGGYSPRLTSFMDICQAAGLTVRLVPSNAAQEVDIHREAAAMFFNTKYEYVSEEQRQFMKRRMFGMMYGTGGPYRD